MHQASAAIVLKFNGRRLCLVFIIIFLLNYEKNYEMLNVGVPMEADMHQASAVIILKFNGRRLCLVFIIIFLLKYEKILVPPSF